MLIQRRFEECLFVDLISLGKRFTILVFGVQSFVAFLETCRNLESFNVTNCGLGPIGGKMIAEAILKNDKMKLYIRSVSQ